MLPTIKKVELVSKKQFTVATFNLDYKTVIIHIAAINISFNIVDKIYPSKKAHIVHLKADEAPTKVFIKYANFANIF